MTENQKRIKEKICASCKRKELVDILQCRMCRLNQFETMDKLVEQGMTIEEAYKVSLHDFNSSKGKINEQYDMKYNIKFNKTCARVSGKE